MKINLLFKILPQLLLIVCFLRAGEVKAQCVETILVPFYIGSGGTASYVETSSCVCNQGYTYIDVNEYAERNFTNPLPVGAVISSMDFIVYGISCGIIPGTVSLNGTALGNVTLVDDCDCSCDSDNFSVSGAASYNTALNTIRIDGNDLAPSMVEIKITYTVPGGPPFFTGMPSNITANAAPGLCNVAVNWLEPIAFNNICAVIPYTSTHNSGDVFAVGVPTTVIYSATDGGITTTESFTVTVLDAEFPVISGMPANITMVAPVGSCETAISWPAVSATDNCGLSSFLSTHNSGDIFSVGITTVTYTAEDNSGNIKLETFDVIIIDDQDPVISGMPSNVSVNTDAGSCVAVVNWTAPVVTDNCLGATITPDFLIGSTFPLGLTTVTYTATDASGNIVTASFTVTVTDNEAPEILGLANITVNITSGFCNAVVTWAAPNITDNCVLGPVSQSHNSGDVFPAGTTTVNYTAEDMAGNSISVSFDVTVVDNESPVISGTPSNISVNTYVGSCDAVVTWVVPSATDNCAVISFTSSHNSGDVFPLGPTTVVYTATDLAGNLTNDSFTITVTDNENPVITNVPSPLPVNAATGICGEIVSWTAPLASDNCSVILTSTHASGSFFPVGTMLVTYTATDPSGNTATASFNVTVIDNQPPAINSVPGNININTDAGVCNAI
ncbi:MAG: HYR domain-containing protein, partial [Bacteroidetes bacterium]|nr:HYR domain-containing protein [Bacteroidota bacterium]